MTKEEIKRTYNMREVLCRYGLSPNRAGVCSLSLSQRGPGSIHESV